MNNPYKRRREISELRFGETAETHSSSDATNGDVNELSGISLMPLPLPFIVNSVTLQNEIRSRNGNADSSTKTSNESSMSIQTSESISNINTNNATTTDNLVHHPKLMPSQQSSVPRNLTLTERLPTNNVSFSFATILTVPETHQILLQKAHNMCQSCSSERMCTSSYQSSDSNATIRHIRVTGVLLYSDPKGNFMILGDALFQPNSAQVKPTSTTLNPSEKHYSTKKKSLSNGQISKTSLPTLTKAVNRVSSAVSTSLSGKKQRLISVKRNTFSFLKTKSQVGNRSICDNNNIDSSISTAVKSDANPSGNKEIHNSTMVDGITSNDETFISHVQHILQKKKGMAMIMIDISKMDSVVGTMGDIIMVIGDVVCNINNTTISEDFNKTLQCLKHSQSNPLGYGKKEINIKTCDCNNCTMAWIEAKIVRISNGLDISLYQEALDMRRLYLKQKYT